MAGNSSTGTSADNPLEGAHPLVGTIAVAETVAPGPKTAEEQRAAIREEYGTYVALAPITHDGALAYNTGDPVPRANVEAWGYEGLGLVSKRTAKAAEAVVHPPATPNPSDPNAPVG